MSKARDLANLMSTGSIFSDGAIAPSEITGVTADATELNKLDGVTATTAELNYTDGVTSNIQTQLDAIPAGTSTSDMAASGDVYVGVNSESYVRFQGSSTVKYARFYLEGDEEELLE